MFIPNLLIALPALLFLKLCFRQTLFVPVRSPWHRAGCYALGVAALTAWSLVVVSVAYANQMGEDDPPLPWLETPLDSLFLTFLLSTGFSLLFFVTGLCAPSIAVDRTPPA